MEGEGIVTAYGDRVQVTNLVMRVMAHPREIYEHDTEKSAAKGMKLTRPSGRFEMNFKVVVGSDRGRFDTPVLYSGRHWPGHHVPFDVFPHPYYKPNIEPPQMIRVSMTTPEAIWRHQTVIRVRRVPITEHDVLHEGIVISGKPTYRSEGVRHDGSGWDDPGWLDEERRVGLLWEVAVRTAGRARIILAWQGDLKVPT